MKYVRILLAVASEVWAMHPEKLHAMLELLAMQADGIKFSAEEIAARIGKQTERDVARREGAVAIVPLRGVIANRMGMMEDISGGTTVDGFTRAFDAAMDDSGVKATIIDTDGPGGNVQGIDEASARVFAARGKKPIIAHVNAQAASATYWIASAADEVILTPSGEVGSIGAFGVHDDVSAMLEKAGIKKTLVSSSDRKGENLPFLPLTEDARSRIQARVDRYAGMFVDALARNRGVSAKFVRENFGQGAMFGPEGALAAKMIDGVATLDETLQRFGVSMRPPQAAPAPRRAFAPQRERRALALR
jgi:signal peptide peptidase SppA